MKEHILSEIKRLAGAGGGKAPGVGAFERETGIRQHEWRGKYWARWGDALIEAGCARNEWQERLDPDGLLTQMAAVCRHFGRVPTTSEMTMYRRDHPEAPNPKTLREHFGSQGGAINRLRGWAASRVEFADVAALLGLVDSQAPGAPALKATNAKVGFVYLIRSGPYHKIGRSEELERRVKQIRVSLPDAAVLEHSIRTDDPAGIEAYWHKRFAARRANGEWFKLSPSDVAAFKRRTYQ